MVRLRKHYEFPFYVMISTQFVRKSQFAGQNVLQSTYSEECVCFFVFKFLFLLLFMCSNLNVLVTKHLMK